MPTQNITVNTNSQLTSQIDFAKIFIFENRFEKAQYTNGTGAPVTLAAGTLLGRISGSGKVTPLTSVSVDGSQFPIGILAQDVVVPDGTTIDLNYCVSGDVAEEKVILQGGDTLNTVIASRRIRDRIGADTIGVKLVAGTEMTSFDN